jgi:ribosomal protein L32
MVTDDDMATMTGLSTYQLSRLAILRRPVPAHLISHKPGGITCYRCREAIDAARQSRRSANTSCDNHAVKRCPTCGNYMTEAHVDLSYVGHAATTDRLLEADPAYWWEPLATTPQGTPAFSDGGLWIRLHVAGMTRIGFGDAAGKSGPNATKEVIGDAIRNAAMRFGFALALWHKGDLLPDDEPATGQPTAAAAQPAAEAHSQAPPAAERGRSGMDLSAVVEKLKEVTTPAMGRALFAAAEADGMLTARVPWDGEDVPLSEAFKRRAAEMAATS